MTQLRHSLQTEATSPADAKADRKTWVARAVVVAAVLTYVLIVLWPTLHAKFWMIDDHQIVRMLGPDHRITLAEYPSVLKEWMYEAMGRFRPGYYVFKVTEAFLFGHRVAEWHVARLVMACLVVAGVYLIAEPFAGPVGAGVAALLSFAGDHVEIWARLGPNEAYALPLALLGIGLIVRSARLGRWRPGDHALGLLALVAAMYTKENFVALPVAIIGVYLTYPLWTRLGVLPRHPRAAAPATRWRVADWAALAATALSTLAFALMMLRQMRRYGHQYGGHLTPDLLGKCIRFFATHLSSQGLWYLAPAVALLVLLVTRPASPSADDDDNRRPRPGRLGDAGSLLAAVAAAALLLLPAQILIYGTSPLLDPRYLMPGWLFVPACAAIGFHFIRRRLAPGWGRAAACLPVVACALTVATINGRALRESWAHWAGETRDFQSQLGRIVRLKRQNPARPILFLVDSAWATEPLYSTVSYLDYYLPDTDGYFMKVVGSGGESIFGQFGDVLMQSLRDQSEKGYWRIRPLADLPPGEAIRVPLMQSNDIPEGRLAVSLPGPWAPHLSGEWESSQGLGHLEGPYPKFGVGYVRWGDAPVTRLTVLSDADGARYGLLVDAAAAHNGQSMEIAVNGHPVQRISFEHAWRYQQFQVRLTLRAGANQIELRHLLPATTTSPDGGGSRPADPAERIVLFKGLKVWQIPQQQQPATTESPRPRAHAAAD